MSLLGNLFAALFGGAPAAAPHSARETQRMAEWEAALHANRLPSFVEARLSAAGAGKAPWLATMSPAELQLARSKGIRPLAMVSGTCWFHYGYSWTRGHADGWQAALSRLQREAAAAGANAIVDVKLRKIRLAVGNSMDFTVLGTAVRLDGLPASPHPIVATVPALEFIRLLEAGIVPVGLAIGAQYDFLQNYGFNRAGGRIDGAFPSPGAALRARLAAAQAGSVSPFTNGPLPELSQFWEGVRRGALAELAQDARRQGNGVLAHTHFGQLVQVEQGDNNPPRFLGRHIVIGTVVDTPPKAGVPHDIRSVVDMRDELSPLSNRAASGHNAYPVHEQEGAI